MATLVSDITINVQDELSKLNLITNELNLPFACETVEAFLITKLKDTILNELRVIAEEKRIRFNLIPPRRFFFDITLFELKVVESPISSTIVHISIQAVNSKRKVLKPLKVKFASSGRFNEIHLSLEPTFLDLQNRFAEFAQVVFESGYRWLIEFVNETVEKINDDASQRCYSVLRKLFKEEIASRVFLWKVTGLKGIFLVDDLTLRNAITNASKRNVSENTSPIEVGMSFSTTYIDFDKTLANIAINEKRIVQDEFRALKYTDTGFDITEIIVFQTENVAVQALVTEGKNMLVASYPAEIRKFIDVTLQKEAFKFGEILSKSENNVENVGLILQNQGTLTEKTIKEIPNTKFVRILRSLEVKPNFAGVGVNLNYSIEEFLKWFYIDRFKNDFVKKD